MSRTAVEDFAIKNFGFESDITIEVFTQFENGANADGIWDYIQKYINLNPVEFGLE